jgi:hypothetical protein
MASPGPARKPKNLPDKVVAKVKDTPLEFDMFYRLLQRKFEPDSLPRRVLDKLSSFSTPIPVEELCQFVRQVTHLQDAREIDARALENILGHAIVVIRGACISLYRRGQNPEAYTITRPDEAADRMIRWQYEKCRMKEFVGQKSVGS